MNVDGTLSIDIYESKKPNWNESTMLNHMVSFLLIFFLPLPVIDLIFRFPIQLNVDLFKYECE